MTDATGPIELETLTDGGQRPADVARGVAQFLSPARTSLDIALYDVRFETAAGALVLAALLAAVQRGVEVRLLYNVAHPGPIPVPPPPETAPDAIEALPVATRGIAGVPDLMHHKFVVRDEEAVWTGSTNWTDDSWSRQENVIVTVDSPARNRRPSEQLRRCRLGEGALESGSRPRRKDVQRRHPARVPRVRQHPRFAVTWLETWVRFCRRRASGGSHECVLVESLCSSCC